jgi:hypothetical protein
MCRAPLALALALAAPALGLSGCALTGTPQAPAGAAPTAATTTTAGAATTTAGAATTTTAALVARAERTHEYPAPAAHQTVVGGWRNPAQAVAVFADVYINWTASTVSVRLRALAEVCVGQARAAMQLAAAQTAQDDELHRGGVANAGVVAAVAPLPGAPRQYVVVTREQTTATAPGAARGLAPAWHVTLATVTPVSGGLWVLSRWQPES